MNSHRTTGTNIACRAAAPGYPAGIMDRYELAEWTGARAAGPVELRVPAEARQLSLIRTVARGVAEREGFTPDEVTDVTVAVDEACACLITQSVPGALLSCRYTIVLGMLRVAVSTTTESGQGPRPHGFGWWVLRTVTDSVSAWRHEQAPRRGGRVVHIDFAKQFAGHLAG